MAAGRRRLTREAFVFIAAAALAALWLSAAGPQHAAAAPCPVPTYGIDAGGNLTIQGTAPCADDPEVIAPYCSGGTVWFDYDVSGAPQGPFNTTVACGMPRRLSVLGNAGDDTLDLSRVSAATGFGGVDQPNVIDGGPGRDALVASPTANTVRGGSDNDIALVRNGVGDGVDCGDGIDAVQSDQAGVDSLSGCEVVDLAPEPVVSPPAAENCVVPELKGLKAGAAKRALTAAGCKFKVKKKFSSKQKRTVLKQSIPPGTPEPVDTVVTIKVSKGPKH